MEFGQLLRELRAAKGVGIKRLAPDLGVSYSYLSKLEGGHTRPSDELVARVSTYFGYDVDLLLLAASHVPPDVMVILRDHPEEAVELLRARFGDVSRSAT